MSAKVWDIFKKNKYNNNLNINEKRFEICKSCVFYNKNIGICKKCGCFMLLKTQLIDAECPIKKW